MTAQGVQKARSWHRLCTLAGDDTRLKTGTESEASHSKSELVSHSSSEKQPMQARTHKISPIPRLFSLRLTRFSFPLICRPLSTQGLYCDIRQLVQFIKEAHGNVFRRVALSALLDSAEKITTAKKTDEKEEAKQSGGRRCGFIFFYFQMFDVV